MGDGRTGEGSPKPIPEECAAGRAPADELRGLMAHDSLAALLWARERAG